MEQEVSYILEITIISFFLIFVFSTITIFVLLLLKKKQIENKNNIEILNYKFEADVLKSNLEIQEETLHHIASEIHDNITLSLTLSKLYLNSIDARNSQNIDELICSSIDLITKSIYDLNDLSKSIDGEMIKKNGLLFSIENEIEKINKINVIRIFFDSKGDIFHLKPEVELLIFRIIQETIKNSLIHSKANSIDMNIYFNTPFLTIIIEDSGIGFDYNSLASRSDKKLSSGISNIKKRANLIKADLLIESEIGKGTRTILKISK